MGQGASIGHTELIEYASCGLPSPNHCSINKSQLCGINEFGRSKCDTCSFSFNKRNAEHCPMCGCCEHTKEAKQTLSQGAAFDINSPLRQQPWQHLQVAVRLPQVSSNSQFKEDKKTNCKIHAKLTKSFPTKMVGGCSPKSGTLETVAGLLST